MKKELKDNYFMQAKLDTAISMVDQLVDCGYYGERTDGYKVLYEAINKLYAVRSYLKEEEKSLEK